MEKIISLDLPYPEISGARQDKRNATIIRQLYSGKHSELKAILQYFYHYLYFIKICDYQTAEVVLSIIRCEIKHLQILGELLINMGEDPVFSYIKPWGMNCEMLFDISYSKTAEKMLLDDIAFEMVSINEYEKMIDAVDDDVVKTVLKRLSLDEELHIKALKERLKSKKSKAQ